MFHATGSGAGSLPGPAWKVSRHIGADPDRVRPHSGVLPLVPPRDRRPALHEAPPHIRKEISQ
ncbi:hypothetical protein [Streptomyces sp. SID13726]|uniref:hypothetical protein n=1 Tax=Streptomyces sp. SID13726 TaxID=2706058 RepID=UPI0013BD1267|nr:hypothetical protein [Streptomyces sp. SID13726]NEB06293.1 hypothetical protein [Streptomyces sp. SID13726]